MAGYFRGVLIFVIFVVNSGVTKFSTHEIFYSHCSSVLMFGPGDVLFRYLCPVDSTLDP